jgi:hypothetical protein
MIAAEFGNDYLDPGSCAQQSQWHPNVIVEAARRLVDSKMPAQDVMNDLPCGGLADGTCNCNNLEAGLPAVFGSQIAEGSCRVLDLEQTLACKFFPLKLPADDGAHGPFGESVGNIIVAVEILARYGEKTVSCFDGSRVGTYSVKAEACCSCLVACICFDAASYLLCQGIY